MEKSNSSMDNFSESSRIEYFVSSSEISFYASSDPGNVLEENFSESSRIDIFVSSSDTSVYESFEENVLKEKCFTKSELESSKNEISAGPKTSSEEEKTSSTVKVSDDSFEDFSSSLLNLLMSDNSARTSSSQSFFGADLQGSFDTFQQHESDLALRSIVVDYSFQTSSPIHRRESEIICSSSIQDFMSDQRSASILKENSFDLEGSGHGSQQHQNEFTSRSGSDIRDCLEASSPITVNGNEDFSLSSSDVFIPDSISCPSSPQSSVDPKMYQYIDPSSCCTNVIADGANDFPNPDDNYALPTEHQCVSEDVEIEGVESQGRKRKLSDKKEKTSRKRQKNKIFWKKNAAAIARAKGEEYVSYNKKLIPKKNVQEGVLCKRNCRLQCSEKFSIEDREAILRSFYTLDINSKNALLFNSIVSKPVARFRYNAKTHKSASYEYYVKYKSETTQVCKIGLCALYQIGRKKLEIVKKHIKSGSTAPKKDGRGKHNNRPYKMDDDVVDFIKAHISSFPAEQSHYSRSKNMNKLYLSPLLSLNKMYDLYLEICEEQGLSEKYKVKKTSYYKMFVTQFNLSFGYPKSDTCGTCDAGDSNEEHVLSYHTALKAMKCDRERPRSSSEVLYITVDLQQTMPLPKLTTSKAFYLRQLSFYNLGVHVVSGASNEKAVCLTWTEDVAGRGSIEVASALLRFVEEDPSCQVKDHLIIWSDSCSGQNKNFNLIVLYQYFIVKGYFSTIDHKFPEVGHTYLDSDRDFGRIEKVLRKHETIYTPQQYRSIIAGASRNNVVVDMTDHFRKIGEMQDRLYLVNRKKNTDNEKICFRDSVKWIRVNKYGSYLYKETYDENTPFKEVDIVKRTGKIDPDYVVPRVEGKNGNLKGEKIENLKEQLKYIKPECRYFYESILQNI